MNWRVSSLDRYRLVSNSDAHSPQKLGREACAFDTDLDYFALRRALETGQGYIGTVEFFRRKASTTSMATASAASASHRRRRASTAVAARCAEARYRGCPQPC